MKILRSIAYTVVMGGAVVIGAGLAVVWLTTAAVTNKIASAIHEEPLR